MTSRPKLTGMLSIICCSALNITLTGGLLADTIVLVQQLECFKSLFPSFSPSLGHNRSLILHLLFRIFINFRRFLQSLKGVFILLSVSPPVRVIWSSTLWTASQQIWDRLSCLSEILLDRPMGQQM